MITLKNVSKNYNFGEEKVYALKNINLKIEKEEYIGVLGSSGSGKSTLMHIIGLLDKPTSGKVLINDINVNELIDDELSSLRNKFVGFVFQQFNLINKLTVLENITLPAIYSKEPLDYDPLEYAKVLLKKFGIEQRANFHPNKISGGQQQRVAIARALIMKPSLVLADEPTGNLDTKTGNEILKLLESLNKEFNTTVIIVTHEDGVASRTKRKIVIKDGEILKQ